jgi:hypothetical protein
MAVNDKETAGDSWAHVNLCVMNLFAMIGAAVDLIYLLSLTKP